MLLSSGTDFFSVAYDDIGNVNGRLRINRHTAGSAATVASVKGLGAAQSLFLSVDLTSTGSMTVALNGSVVLAYALTAAEQTQFLGNNGVGLFADKNNKAHIESLLVG